MDYQDDTLKKRFESNFTRIDENECWLWQGSKFNTGYGRIKYNNKTYIAHRLSLIFYCGMPTDEKPWSLHSCDVKLCVNPNHLRWGTPKENLHDTLERSKTWRKKNKALGYINREKHWKITLEQANEIRELYKTGIGQVKCAEMYGIGATAVFKIVHDLTYRNI